MTWWIKKKSNKKIKEWNRLHVFGAQPKLKSVQYLKISRLPLLFSVSLWGSRQSAAWEQRLDLVTRSINIWNKKTINSDWGVKSAAARRRRTETGPRPRPRRSTGSRAGHLGVGGGGIGAKRLSPRHQVTLSRGHFTCQRGTRAYRPLERRPTLEARLLAGENTSHQSPEPHPSASE